jgi:hypothetical protein
MRRVGTPFLDPTLTHTVNNIICWIINCWAGWGSGGWMGAGMDVGKWRAERYRKGEDKRGEQPYFTFTSIAKDSL